MASLLNRQREEPGKVPLIFLQGFVINDLAGAGLFASVPPVPELVHPSRFSRLGRPFVLLALLASSCAATAAEPAPIPRISDVFNIPVNGMYPHNRDDYRFKVMYPAILETDSMVAATASVEINDAGIRYQRWTSTSFWNRSGDGEATTRTYSPHLPASTGSLAYKSRVYLNTGLSYRVMDRDPAVPAMSISSGAGSVIGDISDRYVILHTIDAYSYGTDLQFLDTDSLSPSGTVEAKVRTARVAIGENEIFLASEKNGRLKLHRMAYPDFSKGNVVKAKLGGVAGTYSWINHFSPLHAVAVDQAGHEVIIRWSDPLNGGKIRLYRSSDTTSHRWFETGGRLGVISTYPELSISHVRFNANGTYDFEPAGMPKGFRNLAIHSIGPDSVFMAGPKDNSNFRNTATWCHRVSLAPGRQLYVDPAVADEQDGQIRFRVSLDRASDTPVTFDYQAASRTADEGEDFPPTSGSATLVPGETETFISVPLIEDYTLERPEALELQITGLSGAFCDSLRTPGRIRGSGMRVRWDIKNDTDGVLPTLDASVPTFGGMHTLTFPGGPVVARDHGFEQFIPIAENGGSYYYARGQKLGTDQFVLCQFDPARGELTEVFPNDAPRKRDGDELIVQNGQRGYLRYSFFDGFPTLSLDHVTVSENGGPQTFIARSERTWDDFNVTTQWADLWQEFGTFTVERTVAHDLLFHFEPESDGESSIDLRPPLLVNFWKPGNGQPSSTLLKVTVKDSTAVTTTPVATTVKADVLACSGNRLWLGERGNPLLQGMKFENGTLVPAGTAKLPTGASLNWLGYYNESYSGQGLACDGDRLLSGFFYSYQNRGSLMVSGASSAKPATKLMKSTGPGSANLIFAGYQAVGMNDASVGTDGAVQILDSRSGKKLALLKAPVTEPSFGYSLAYCGNILWIGAPRADGGKVYGFNVPGFTPGPILYRPYSGQPAGAFGYAIAGSESHLVIGEPSNQGPGTAWVFSPDGNGLKRGLSSRARDTVDGFGARVAVRGERVLIGGSRLALELNSLATTPQPWPAVPTEQIPDGSHYQAMLWNDIDYSPIPLRASCHGLADHASGWAIGLLDDCAVLASRGPDGGAVEVYKFAAPSP